MTPGTLRKNALLLEQSGTHRLFLFSLSGEELEQITCVSQISREATGDLVGYQRPEVRRHVATIAEYLRGQNVLFPNSIILAFQPGVRFEAADLDRLVGDHSTPGVLTIPLPGPRDAKPGWIVDGQQRTAALTKARRDLPVPVCAFVTGDVDVQRDQFLRVNSVKPLPRGLITELLPHTAEPLTTRLEPRAWASRICDRLNQEQDSPFYQLVSRPSGRKTAGKGVVTDSSIVSMVEHSLVTPSGCLFPYTNLATNTVDENACVTVLKMYWSAVRDVFPLSWGLSPRQSRLMHGVGIRSMGRLMDRMMAGLDPTRRSSGAQVKQELQAVAPFCRWTDGVWDELESLPWNEVQNVPSHTRKLTSYLLSIYLRIKGGDL